MFTVIESVENNNGRLKKIFDGFVNTPPELVKIAVKNGAPFFKIKLKNDKRIPWDEIMFMAGRCASNVIVDSKINLPDDVNVKKFEPKVFPMLVLLNTVYDVLCKMKIQKAVIGIVDYEAVLCDYIGRFAEISSVLTIVTHCSDKYEHVCSDIFDKKGLSVILTDNEEFISSCEFTVSEYPIENAMNFSFYGDSDGKNCAYGINIPSNYKQKVQSSVDELLYASALYELCRVKRLMHLSFSDIYLNGKICNVSEIENSLKLLFN